MKNITFVIFTYNEEKRIEYIIKNFINFGEVLIMDDGSTDRTKEIAEKMGAKYFLRPKTGKAYVESPEVFDFVKRAADTSWVYWGHADQMMPKTLLDRLVDISNQEQIKYVFLPFYTYLWGDTENVMLKGNYPVFFRKEYMDFSGDKIHGLGRFIGKDSETLRLPDKLEFAIRHYSLYDLNKFILGHLNYAKAEAQQKHDFGIKYSSFYLLGAMLRYFIMYYKRAFRSGAKGLIISLLNAFFRVMVYARLYEIENNITLENIEENYIKEKNKIINKLND
jgi:glycosyltransferase involved in cell wall biosynthesis